MHDVFYFVRKNIAKFSSCFSMMKYYQGVSAQSRNEISDRSEVTESIQGIFLNILAYHQIAVNLFKCLKCSLKKHFFIK